MQHQVDEDERPLVTKSVLNLAGTTPHRWGAGPLFAKCDSAAIPGVGNGANLTSAVFQVFRVHVYVCVYESYLCTCVERLY